MKRGLLVVALAAAVLVVPAAAAGRTHRVKLAVVALPKSALGAAGRSLAVSPDSGFISNPQVNSISGGPSTFDRLGRITGYDLTYGDRYSGESGITQISTGLEKYKASTAARRGLAFWRKDDPKITEFQPYGLPVTVKALKASKVGTGRFAEAITFTVPNAAPVSLVDEQFTDGPYVLHATVAAGSLPAAANLAGKLARALDRRLRLAEAGQLRGKPVKVPSQLKAGPPPGGPVLATLGLTTSDLGAQAMVLDEGYESPNAPSLSSYTRAMQPAGSFGSLSQLIDWFSAANDATIRGRFEAVGFAYALGEGLLTGVPGQFTPVDLSTVGDNAYGAIVSVKPTGRPTVYFVVVALSSGQASDLVLAGSRSQVQPGDVVNLAQLAADRLNAGLVH